MFIGDDCGAATAAATDRAGRGHAGVVMAYKLLGEASQTSGRSLEGLTGHDIDR